jgi:hypothetical protein
MANLALNRPRRSRFASPLQFPFKPILLAAHLPAQPNYGDNSQSAWYCTTSRRAFSCILLARDVAFLHKHSSQIAAWWTWTVQGKPTIHDGVKWPTHACSRVLVPLIQVLVIFYFSLQLHIEEWMTGVAGRPDIWPKLFLLFYAMQLKQKFEK